MVSRLNYVALKWTKELSRFFSPLRGWSKNKFPKEFFSRIKTKLKSRGISRKILYFGKIRPFLQFLDKTRIIEIIFRENLFSWIRPKNRPVPNLFPLKKSTELFASIWILIVYFLIFMICLFAVFINTF